jgi:peptidoglycan/LPS O-acetylase OafA/YrhL
MLALGTAVFQAVHKLERLGVHTGGSFDPMVVAAICVVSLGLVFLATRIKSVPLPAKVVLAAGGITYPLYLLHMQLGYVIFTTLHPERHVGAVTCAIVFGAFVLAYAVWRLFERSAHRSTQVKLTELAGRAGFEVGVKLV